VMRERDVIEDSVARGNCHKNVIDGEDSGCNGWGGHPSVRT